MQLQDGAWRRSTRPYPVANYVNGQRFEVMPGVIYNTAVQSGAPDEIGDALEVFDPAAEIRRPELRRLIVLREGELGDIVAVAAALRMVKRIWPQLQVVLGVHARYLYFAQAFHGIEIVMMSSHLARSRNKDVLALDLTGYLELDHTPGMLRVNRIERVLRLFGVVWDPA